MIVTALVLGAVIEGLRRSARLATIFSSWWLTGLFIAVLALYSLLGYPHEHARQALHSGSTSDQAMQRTWNALIHGRNMYAVHLSGDAPISPGPLWVVLNGPFTLARAYAWMNPVWLAVTAIACACGTAGPPRSTSPWPCWLSLPAWRDCWPRATTSRR